ncbi:MAG: pyridoxamine 5'-phosphate oxidase family protein [Candidatus Omnitrophota bacterium]|jgi:nitroimidazol reductase NimA-like FMN-containing flavoprotein (pyridoxamine 5'-phosphate oxidase superfamily)
MSWHKDHQPVLRRRHTPGDTELIRRSVRDRIRKLLTSQRFAILCTQGLAQPYASIVGFAASDDLKSIYFSTPKTTRKYRLLTRCSKVAIQADNRSHFPKKFMSVESVTATGKAGAIKGRKESLAVADILRKRHPYLKSFFHSPTCALIRVRVLRYLHVSRFQEVGQWIPDRRRSFRSKKLGFQICRASEC